MKFFQFLKPANLPRASAERTVLQIRREIILQYILNILLVLYTLGLPLLWLPNVIRSSRPGLYLIPYLFLVTITAVRTLNYHIRAFTLILALQGLGTMALIVYGLSGTGIIFLIGAAMLANMLYNQRVGLPILVLCLANILLVGWSMHTGALPLPTLTPVMSSGSITQWGVAAAVFLFILALTVGSIYIIVQGMSAALKAQENLTRELEEEQASQERRVEQRSIELKNRVNQFEIASQIARAISGETNLEKLLNTAANLIRDRFGFYHVGIFVNDAREEYTVLRAATGDAGRLMLERNHQLKIGEIGMVGYAVIHGEPRISMDVTADIVHYKNPMLPETRSEMALPLRTGERTIGALDVQSVVMDAFTQEDVRILQIIADQLAVAFEKTRLVDELQRNVNELNAVQRAATQKAWRLHLRNSRQRLAYHFHHERLDGQVDETEHAQEAVSKGQLVIKVVPGVEGQERPVTVLAVPIKLRSQVLGVVDIRFNNATVSPDLISLIEGTVNRLAVSLENARLLEELQTRAERERLVSEITSKVRAAPDVDSVLRIAIQEIGQSLGVSEVMVQLRKET